MNKFLDYTKFYIIDVAASYLILLPFVVVVEVIAALKIGMCEAFDAVLDQKSHNTRYLGWLKDKYKD